MWSSRHTAMVPERMSKGEGIMEMKEKVLQKFGEVFGDTEGVKTYFAPGRETDRKSVV